MRRGIQEEEERSLPRGVFLEAQLLNVDNNVNNRVRTTTKQQKKAKIAFHGIFKVRQRSYSSSYLFYNILAVKVTGKNSYLRDYLGPDHVKLRKSVSEDQISIGTTEKHIYKFHFKR